MSHRFVVITYRQEIMLKLLSHPDPPGLHIPRRFNRQLDGASDRMTTILPLMDRAWRHRRTAGDDQPSRPCGQWPDSEERRAHARLAD